LPDFDNGILIQNIPILVVIITIYIGVYRKNY